MRAPSGASWEEVLRGSSFHLHVQVSPTYGPAGVCGLVARRTGFGFSVFSSCSLALPGRGASLRFRARVQQIDSRTRLDCPVASWLLHQRFEQRAI